MSIFCSIFRGGANKIREGNSKNVNTVASIWWKVFDGITVTELQNIINENDFSLIIICLYDSRSGINEAKSTTINSALISSVTGTGYIKSEIGTEYIEIYGNRESGATTPENAITYSSYGTSPDTSTVYRTYAICGI